MTANEWVNLRVTGDEKDKSDAVIQSVQDVYPILTRAQILRAALREGLAVLAKRPRRALQSASAVQ